MAFLEAGELAETAGGVAETAEAAAEAAKPRSYTPMSTCIARVDYDPKTLTATVTFVKGQTIVIKKFPEDVLQDWMNAPSVGQYWNEVLRGKY